MKNKLKWLYIGTFVFAFFFCSNEISAQAKEKISVNKTVVDLNIDSNTTTEEESGLNIDFPDTDNVSDTGNEVPNESQELQEMEDITDGLIPDVSAENFFQKIYNKVFAVCNGTQKIIAIILIIFFVIDLISVAYSCFTQPAKVPLKLLILLIIAILFVLDIYAVQIIKAFSNWFVS